MGTGQLDARKLRFRGIFNNQTITYTEDDAIYAILPAGEVVHIYKMHVRPPAGE